MVYSGVAPLKGLESVKAHRQSSHHNGCDLIKDLCVFLSTRSVVRLTASVLTKLVDSLAPSITSVLVHGKQVSTHAVGGLNHSFNHPFWFSLLSI